MKTRNRKLGMLVVLVAWFVSLPTATALARNKGRNDNKRPVVTKRNDRNNRRVSRRNNDNRRVSRRNNNNRVRVIVRFGSVSPGITQRPVQGHYETRTEQVLVAPGHYEIRTEQVLVEAGHWETRYIPAVLRTVYDSEGRRYTMVITPARTERYWCPPRYETRSIKVWVPARYEIRTVQVWVPGYVSAKTPRARTGFSLFGLLRW